MSSVKIPTTGHPQIMVTGPPNLSPAPKVVVIPVRTEMMENVTAKLEKALKGDSE